jgi:hypothetical protein
VRFCRTSRFMNGFGVLRAGCWHGVDLLN